MSRGVHRAPLRPAVRLPVGPTIQLCVFALTFVLVAMLVVTSSRAAFVAQTGNIANQVTSAAIDLADNDAGAAMFQNVTGLMPGTNVDRCIDVTYTGTVDPVAVRLYAPAAPTGSLAPYLDLTVDIGADTADPFATCTSFVSTGTVYSGTLDGFTTAHGGYATGVTTWDPAGSPETRTFRFRLSVQNDAAAEGLTTTFGFSWETRTS
jgi:hypothetical protein